MVLLCPERCHLWGKSQDQLVEQPHISGQITDRGAICERIWKRREKAKIQFQITCLVYRGKITKMCQYLNTYGHDCTWSSKSISVCQIDMQRPKTERAKGYKNTNVKTDANRNRCKRQVTNTSVLIFGHYLPL